MELACKPGSVVFMILLINTGSHPSWINITIYLERPNPGEGGPPYPPLFGLSPDAVCKASLSPDCRWALTPPFHPYRNIKFRRCIFCCTFAETSFYTGPAGRYPASCPVEPGLSSQTGKGLRDYPANSVYMLHIFIKKSIARTLETHFKIKQ